MYLVIFTEDLSRSCQMPTPVPEPLLCWPTAFSDQQKVLDNQVGPADTLTSLDNQVGPADALTSLDNQVGPADTLTTLQTCCYCTHTANRCERRRCYGLLGCVPKGKMVKGE